jgi:pimeloyl-ACP methyl ester carboxylesterase
VIVCLHGAGDTAAQWDPLRRLLPDEEIRAPAAPVDPTLDLRPSVVAESLVPHERVALVGFSWGASVAARFAVAHPRLVAALALVEGGHVDFRDVPHEPPTDGLDAALYRGLVEEPNAETWPALQRAGYPLLLIASAMSERFAAAVPRAEIVPGAGHRIDYATVASWLVGSRRSPVAGSK